MFFEEYRRSLKMPEAEEYLDLLLYRPAAYLFVMGVKSTPITPNQITFLSLIAGCFAAYQFSLGVESALFIGGIWYAIANILDCADGQLARIKKNGTPLGRIIDGIADYISSVAIFLGIGIGLSVTGNDNWWLVIAGGLSSAFQAIKFDDAQGRFISTVRGEEDFTTMEIEKYSLQVEALRNAGKSGLRLLTLTMYLKYLKFQQQFRPSESIEIDREQFKKSNTWMIRLWTFLGPTTNRSMLIVSALLGNVTYFLWAVVLGGNVWLVLCSLLQKRIDKMLSVNSNQKSEISNQKSEISNQ